MNELSNTVNGTGTYDNVPISLSSNISVVKLVDGLTLTLAADKTYWKDGNLKYTITLNNATDMSYENVKLTDVLDTAYITFINDSVEVNNVAAHQTETIISFSKKKLNNFFILINSVLGTLSDGNSV